VYRDVFFDRFGLWASMVARCGGEQKFFGISDMIYEQQRDWIGSGSDPVEIANNLRKIGKVAGLSDDKVEACLSDADRAKTLVAWYQENSETHDISSTPTLIINGKKHSNMPYSELSGLIDDLLAE
jgi:protein-disulfide isomerase